MSNRDKIEKFIFDMGLSLDKTIEKEEIFIVSSAEYGLKNLVIDIEDDYVIFFLRLGEIKNVITDKDNNIISKEEIYKMLLKMNNALTGILTTGQFGLEDNDEKDILIFSEQHLMEDFNFIEFKDTIEGFSTNLVNNISIIKNIVVTNEGE